LPLFTGVRGRAILRTSPRGGSRNFTCVALAAGVESLWGTSPKGRSTEHGGPRKGPRRQRGARSFAETLAESYRVVYGQAAESAERQQQRTREFSEVVSINRHFSPRGAMTPILGRGQCSCQDTLTTISTAAKKKGLRGEGSSAWNGPRFLHRRVDQRDR
jgi:hypothetical protein